MYYIKIIDFYNTFESYNLHDKKDLFILIKFNNQFRRTISLWDNYNPYWNETHLFNIDNITDTIVTLELYETNLNILLSETFVVNLENIKNSQTTYFNIEHGSLYYKYTNELNIQKSIQNMNEKLIKQLQNENKKLNNQIINAINK
jgi:hypothetical protein